MSRLTIVSDVDFTSPVFSTLYVEACIVPDFAIPYYNSNDTIPNWYLSDSAGYAFTYRVEKTGDENLHQIRW